MREYEAGIIRTENCGNGVYIIEIDCSGIACDVSPGRFVQVRVGSGTDPFLRRTFSVCGSDPERGTFRLLVDNVGPGTGLLCSMKRGGTVSVIGGLGTGFNTALGGDCPCVMVSGGSGAAPLLFLAERLSKESSRDVTFLSGARTASGHAAVKKLMPADVCLLTATDDGSEGYHGFVSGLLAERLSEISPSAVFTCGPHPMMKAVASVAAAAGIPCQVSLEERMACGIGACLGCAVEMRDGRMVRSCVDGPVFDAGEVVL